MSLELQINTKLKAAMIAKDQAALRALRAVKSAILLAKTEKGSDHNLSPEKEMQILQKLVKQRNDSLAIFREQNREDLAVIEEEEVQVIQQFLPEALSEEQIRSKLSEIISQSGASDLSDIGKVMGPAMKAMAGKADGKVISRLVKELLAG